MPPAYHANPAAQDRYIREQAWREISTMGAVNFGYLIAARAWQFVRPYPTTNLHAPWQFWCLTLYNLALYAVALGGIWRYRRNWASSGGLLLVFICGLAAHSIFFVCMRHRVPFVEPALIIFAAAAIAGCRSRGNSSRLRRR
ncbi:hypothetical protein FACS1894139_19100 [Planctomycetales bacterium]|nr:hypothetical protein FACS1894139_19100 [Planctomycetales bacterium]